MCIYIICICVFSACVRFSTSQVYTVGPDYAHAEARKSPALDGKVERDSEGKEIRYPVMLTAMEKLVARKVCLAFKVNLSHYVADITCCSGEQTKVPRHFIYFTFTLFIGLWFFSCPFYYCASH